MMKSVLTIFAVLVVIFLFSCEKIRQLPPEPMIEFRNFTLYDTIDILGNPAKAGILEFYFEDGDGDVGLNQPLPGEQDSTNAFFVLYRKNNGAFIEADETDSSYPSDYRIPWLERTGQNKTLMGTIEITFLYFFYDISDTIMYDFYIKDRAGNESNIETTCEIPFSLDGPCSQE